MIATTLLVVPKSMPIIFAIEDSLIPTFGQTPCQGVWMAMGPHVIVKI
jgi:hypothetical protein